MPLSYSALASYRRCPRRYEFTFVKKLPQPMTGENAFGISMHSVLARFGKMEMERQNEAMRKCDNAEMQKTLFFEEETQPKIHHLTPSTLFDLWNSSFGTNGYPTKAAADFDRARGERLLQKFYEWWGRDPTSPDGLRGAGPTSPDGLRGAGPTSPDGLRGTGERKVIGVERPFRANLSDVSGSLNLEVTGRFDRVEELADGSIRIIDFKTGEARLQEFVDQDLQLSLYAIAAKETFKKDVSGLVMLFLADEEVTEVATRRSHGELQTTVTTMRILAERIATRDFAPTPSKERCSECPYRRVCDASASP